MFTVKEQLVMGVAAVILAASAFWAYWQPGSGALPQWEEIQVPQDDSAPAEPEEARTILVHVAGEVEHPGVYEMEEGARVLDAITAAGGPTEDGQPDLLNLARVLSDGQRVWVPGQDPGGNGGGEPPPAGGEQAVVNVNRASWSQLQALPGIGPALAQRIIDYRLEHGLFTVPEDLLKISGIGDRTLEGLLPHIRLD